MEVGMRFLVLALVIALPGPANAISCDDLANEGRRIIQKTSYVMEITREAESKGSPNYDAIFGFKALKTDSLLLDANIYLQENSRCYIHTEIRVGRDDLTVFMNSRRRHF
jgi:hypothetical protein